VLVVLLSSARPEPVPPDSVRAASPVKPRVKEPTAVRPPAKPAKRDTPSRSTGTPTRQVAVTVRVLPAPVTITRLALQQNFPNPVAATTTIQYAIPKRTNCSVAVYSASGQRIVTLVAGMHDPGSYVIEWNGTDERGRRLRAGLYFYRLITGENSISRKMTLF
jgi:hypothetical protein